MKRTLPLLTLLYSLGALGNPTLSVTCKNSERDSVQVFEEQKAILKENGRATKLTILGSDTYEHYRPCRFFCSQDEDGHVHYYVFREARDIVLNVMDLYEKELYGELVDTKSKKTIKTYKTCYWER